MMFRECRFCHETTLDSELVKYGIRHYAHATCYLKTHGVKGVDRLPTFQKYRFSELLAQEEAEAGVE
jgi:hypothetical protein